MLRTGKQTPLILRCVEVILVVIGAVLLTSILFLILPLTQAISKPPRADVQLADFDAANIPPPPPPIEDEPEEPESEDVEPPKLEEDLPLPDLSQLELAMNPGLGDGLLGGDFTINLDKAISGKKDIDALFSLSDLDQPPRVIHQTQPVLTAAIRKKAPGTVWIAFVVNDRGRAEAPKVMSSSDAVFDQAALKAVMQWKFEPGKRKGKPVRFRMRVPFTFPKG